jgi:hypothetical protein
MGSIINAGADLLGVGPASKQANATTKAADAAAASSRYAADLQKQMFDKQLELQAPFRASGLAAQNRLNELLGLGPRYDQSFNNFNAGAYLNANPDAKAWVDSQTQPSFKKPDGSLAGLAKAVLKPQSLMSKSGKNPEQLAYEHWVADGSRRQGDFWRNQTPAAGYGKYTKDFSMQDFTTDPGYAFRMSEGLKALDRQAAARGGLISGGALKAAERYGQDLGSQEYTNAFNRYQTNRANQLNPLQSITGAGQTATNQLASAAGNYGVNAGNIAMTGGANQANAYLTKGNIAASQYGTYGKALDEVLDTDWTKVGNKIKGFFE